MTAFLFSRSEMAVSLAFHIIFVAIGIGMPVHPRRGWSSIRNFISTSPAAGAWWLNLVERFSPIPEVAPVTTQTLSSIPAILYLSEAAGQLHGARPLSVATAERRRLHA
jgi:hypothetical protein